MQARLGARLALPHGSVSVMNSSFYSLDRTTHLKILLVAAAMASLVLAVFAALS
jgi:hypothetical protein